MGLFDMFDPEKSTAAWAAKLFKGICKKDWDLARRNRDTIFLEMLKYRQGTPTIVSQGVLEGSISRLSELCTAILVSEAIQVNTSDIPELQEKQKALLQKKGIPSDLC